MKQRKCYFQLLYYSFFTLFFILNLPLHASDDNDCQFLTSHSHTAALKSNINVEDKNPVTTKPIRMQQVKRIRTHFPHGVYDVHLSKRVLHF